MMRRPSSGGRPHALTALVVALAVLAAAGSASVPAAPQALLPELGGHVLWEARYDGPSGGSDWGNAIGVHPTGLLVYVTGNSQDASADFATVAYEAATGLPVWTARWDGPAGGSDFPNALGVDPQGARVFVAGYTNSPATSNDFAVVAYDAILGLELWAVIYDAPASGSDVVYDLAIDPDGARIYVTGGSAGIGTGTDYLTIAFDAATGETVWMARYDGPTSGFDIPWAVTVAPAGNAVYVTGQSRDATADMLTVAYDATTGAELWVARHDGPAASVDNANDVVVHPDGDVVFVGGYTRGVDTSNDLTVVAYDAASGTQLWVSRYDGPGTSADYAQALAVDPDGTRVYATGYSWGGSTTRADIVAIAFDAASGAELWVARYDGPASGLDAGEDIAVSPDGERVYVVGYSEGSGTGRDYATMAYDAATGAEMWLQRYDGGANGLDHPRGIAADPLGLRVYVTGNSMGQGTGMDFGTVAYLDVR